MLSEKFFEVIKEEGVVSINSWGSGEKPNVRCNWNSYLRITDDECILVPIAGFTSVQADDLINKEVIMTLGSSEVESINNYQGKGFMIEGQADFLDSGDEFEKMHAEFPFMNKLLKIKVESAKQLL